MTSSPYLIRNLSSSLVLFMTILMPFPTASPTAGTMDISDSAANRYWPSFRYHATLAPSAISPTPGARPMISRPRWPMSLAFSSDNSICYF